MGKLGGKVNNCIRAWSLKRAGGSASTRGESVKQKDLDYIIRFGGN